MRPVKAKSPEQAALLLEISKDFRRYLKKLDRSDDPVTRRLQDRLLVEVTCPICGAVFADMVDAEKWSEGSAWVWCKKPGHRNEIQQSAETMVRVEMIRATWCAGIYFTLGLDVTWTHRKRLYRGEITAIAAPYHDAIQVVPCDTPKSRLMMQVKNEHGYRAVLKKQEGTKPVYYVVSLSNCRPAEDSSSQIS